MDEDNVAQSSSKNIHILLVHKDQEFVDATRLMLQQMCYRVTTAGLAHDALNLLQSGNKECIDLVMAHADLPDFDEFLFLQTTKRMNLLTILISSKNEIDNQLATKAIKQGALFYFKTPLPVGILKCLWQFVAKQKQEKRLKENSRRLENIEKTTTAVEKKLTMTWTDELKKKFSDAARELGDGNCFPTTILEKMNVEGLQKPQVLSFLQKARAKNMSNPLNKNLSKKRRNSYLRNGSLPSIIAQSSTTSPNSSKNNHETSAAPKNSSVPTNTSEAPAVSSMPTNNVEANESSDRVGVNDNLSGGYQIDGIENVNIDISTDHNSQFTDELYSELINNDDVVWENNHETSAAPKTSSVPTNTSEAPAISSMPTNNVEANENGDRVGVDDNLSGGYQIDGIENVNIDISTDHNSLFTDELYSELINNDDVVWENNHKTSAAPKTSSVNTSEAPAISSMPTNNLEANESGDRVGVNDNLNGGYRIDGIENVNIDISTDLNSLFPNELYADLINDDILWENWNLGPMSPNGMLSEYNFSDVDPSQTYHFENSAFQEESQQFLTEDALNLWVNDMIEPEPFITNHDKDFDKRDKP